VHFGFTSIQYSQILRRTIKEVLKYENASVHLAVFDPEVFEVTTSYFETYNDCSELFNMNDVCTLDSRVFNLIKYTMIRLLFLNFNQMFAIYRHSLITYSCSAPPNGWSMAMQSFKITHNRMGWASSVPDPSFFP